MRINPVNNQVNFGRVIKVNSVTNIRGNSNVRRVDDSTYEIAKVLNNKNSYVYSPMEAEKIKNFFVDILGDYNKKNKVKFIRVGGQLYLLSGKDEKEFDKRSKKSDDFLGLCLDFKDRVEVGGRNKSRTTLNISSSTFNPQNLTVHQLAGKDPIYAKLDTFDYESMTKMFKESIDGFRLEESNPCYNDVVSQATRNLEDCYYEKKAFQL